MTILLADSGWLAENITGSLAAGIPIAFLVGLFSFLSPCVLPLLPAYLSYITGFTVSQVQSGRRRVGRAILGTVLFILGFSIVFVLVGAMFGGVGALLVRHRRLVEIAGGIIAIFLGLIFADLIKFGQNTIRFFQPKHTGILFAPLLGASFAVGWTPCIGPALGAVLTLSMNEGSFGKGALLAGVYCLGLGFPFILAAAAFQAVLGSLDWVKRNHRVIQLVGGAMLMAVGILMVSGLWRNFVAVITAGY